MHLRLIPAAALLLALLLSHAAAFAAEARSLVNRAAEQRMLSQRLVKSYSQLALGTMPREAATQLRDSVERFETNMRVLGSPVAQTPESRPAHGRMAAAWERVREKLFDPPTRESALALARLGDELLASAEHFTHFVDRSPEIAGAVNIAGRQRMLSQRVAKAYMLKALSEDSTAFDEQIRAASREFGNSLQALGRRPENTPQIRKELDELALQWEWLQAAIDTEGAVSYRLIVAESAEAILSIADRITGLYEQRR